MYQGNTVKNEDIEIEFLEVLNIFGLNGDRRKIVPHSKIQLVENMY